jgi:hypothetical protein
MMGPYHSNRPGSLPPKRSESNLGVLPVLAVLLSACSITTAPTFPDAVAPSAGATETTEAPHPALCDFGGTWSVNFLLSGGLAGIRQELILSSDGQASYTDRSAAAPTTWALGSDELQELQRLLGLACPFELQGSRPSPCMDCFVYRLEVVSEEKRYLWEGDESQVTHAAIRSLLDLLEVIRSRAP